MKKDKILSETEKRKRNLNTIQYKFIVTAKNNTSQREYRNW